MPELFASRTQNTRKVTITLEAMGVDYTVRALRLSQNAHKEPWFLRLNPNGRLPVYVDDEGPEPFAIAESAAILVHLAEVHGRFYPTERRSRAATMQWLMFQMSALGPAMGQASHFRRAGNELAAARFVDETRRLVAVLDGVFARSRYVVGDAIGIADFALLPWLVDPSYAGVDYADAPNVARYVDELQEIPFVARGLARPSEADFADRSWLDGKRAEGERGTGPRAV